MARDGSGDSGSCGYVHRLDSHRLLEQGPLPSWLPTLKLQPDLYSQSQLRSQQID